jgi:hypothetical protein
MESLEVMASCHHVAERAIAIVRYLYTSLDLNLFAPNIREEDFLCSSGGLTHPDEHRGVERSTQAATVVESPLFAPFPMQGRLTVLNGPKLEEAGFAPI